MGPDWIIDEMKRSGLRGARISNPSGQRDATRAIASNTGFSSPAITLPATSTGPGPPRASSSRNATLTTPEATAK